MDLCALAESPAMEVKTYKNFNINGYRFRTKLSEESCTTQNSGCVVQASTSSFTSTRHRCPIDGDVTYYGVLKDIIELSFSGGRKVVLFECDRSDTSKNKMDSYGFTIIDFTMPAKKVNPFVLPNQVLQAFYVSDPCDIPWTMPTVTKPRDNFDLKGAESLDDEGDGLSEILPHQTSLLPSAYDDDDMEE